jgi:predicted RNase H-like HicB family nuclease
VTRVIRVPYVAGQDEDGAWSASARLRPGVGAFGDGPTRETAFADLRAGLGLLLDVICGPGDLVSESPLCEGE